MHIVPSVLSVPIEPISGKHPSAVRAAVCQQLVALRNAQSRRPTVGPPSSPASAFASSAPPSWLASSVPPPGFASSVVTGSVEPVLESTWGTGGMTASEGRGPLGPPQATSRLTTATQTFRPLETRSMGAAYTLGAGPPSHRRRAEAPLDAPHARRVLRAGLRRPLRLYLGHRRSVGPAPVPREPPGHAAPPLHRARLSSPRRARRPHRVRLLRARPGGGAHGLDRDGAARCARRARARQALRRGQGRHGGLGVEIGRA